MKKLADYRANAYDWRKIEARLNALPQFTTNIDGLDTAIMVERAGLRCRLIRL